MLFIFIGIGLTAWETMARLTRGQVLSVREKEFVEAARTIGAGNVRIMFRHILPNILGPLIVDETLAIPGYITSKPSSPSSAWASTRRRHPGAR